MTTYGLTLAGLVIPTLQEIKEEIEQDLRDALGNGINLLPTELLGQIVGIIAYRRAQDFQTLQGVYNSQYPVTANGVPLDDVLSLTAIRRLKPTFSTGAGIAYGEIGTLIPSGQIVSVTGNADAKFLTSQDATIAAGTDEIQSIQFSSVPDAGTWSIIYDGNDSGTLQFNDVAATVEAALNSIISLDVAVSGDYSAGFTITFQNDSGSQPQLLLHVGTSLLSTTGTNVSMGISVITPGVLPNVSIPLIAQNKGAVIAYAGTLTTIETPVPGWTSFTNPLDIDNGKDTETDAAARLRQQATLATSGSTTVDAIRSHLLDIDAVTDARVFENVTDAIDIIGRPPHSFEAVVENGLDQDIVDTIWEFKPAGIQTYGAESGSAIDSMGLSHTINFSRPIPINIYMILNITVDSSFPVGGDAALKDAIVALGDLEFGIGDDVITIRFFDAVNTILGIVNAEILIGIAPAPTLPDNIVIAEDEKSGFDTSRITVNHV